MKNINEFNETLTYGRLPQNENEIIINERYQYKYHFINSEFNAGEVIEE